MTIRLPDPALENLRMEISEGFLTVARELNAINETLRRLVQIIDQK